MKKANWKPGSKREYILKRISQSVRPILGVINPSKHTPRSLSGEEAELKARNLLKGRGLMPLLSNFHCRGGEIDLVMVDKRNSSQILVCVEVRYRRNRRYGGAAQSITQRKRDRIVLASQHLLKHLSKSHALSLYAELPVRFDVVAIDGLTDKLEYAWLQGAFEC